MADIAWLLGGLVLLVVGGELLVRGAVQAAERLGVSPLLIGLTLVGFGTSTPELVTSVQASLAGSPGIAIGNVVGSNIANILLILGVAALIFPVAVATSALKRDGTLVVATAVLLAGVSAVMVLDRLVGAVFVALLGAYIFYAWRQESIGAPEGHTSAYEKAHAFEETHEKVVTCAPKPAGGSILIPLLTAVAGLAIVVVGGNFLVSGAIAIARSFGISETVIGLTIVAVGTSMPELVTSVIAAIRKNSDVALGNILGSNIYNTLGIGGVTALIAPVAVPVEIIRFDNLVMIAVSVAMVIFATTGRVIGRVEGGLLVAGYVAYVWWIWPT
jgi:cation:H+ antiporter